MPPPTTAHTGPNNEAARRRIDVREIEPGVLALIGQVRITDERRAARALLAAIKGVDEIEDRLEVTRRDR